MTTTSTRCPLCKTMVLATDNECQTCGFPVHGSSIEKEEFKRIRAEKRKTLDKAKTAVTWAKSVLAIMAFLTLIILIINFSQYMEADGFQKEEMEVGLIATGIMCTIYIGLAILSGYKPYPAIVAGFALYGLTLILNGIDNPATIAQGFLWKGLILAAFIKGTYSVATMENLDQELDHWKKK